VPPLISVDAGGLRPDGLIGALDALGGSMADEHIANIANAARAHWLNLAASQLRSTSGIYERGIQDPVILGDTARISLLGVMPNMVENGASAFDMRDALCGPSSRNRKPIMKKRAGQAPAIVGWYNTIPFRHGTPGTTGRNFAEMGEAFSPDAEISQAAEHTVLTEEERNQVRERVYDAARQLRTTVGRSGGGSVWGGRLQAGLAPLLRGHHKTDIYAGMIKAQGAYDRETQSGYVTFRRISTTETSGWKHPGIKARHFAEKVAEFVQRIGGAAIVQQVVEESST